MKMVKFFVLTMSMIFLYGCDHCKPSLKATWYMVNEQIYVALLNQGSESISIKEIILNPDKDNKSYSRILACKKDKQLILSSGKIRFLSVRDFLPHDIQQDCSTLPTATSQTNRCTRPENTKCLVPVALKITTEPESFLNGTCNMGITGAMPTLVPNNWETECGLDP